MADAIPVIPKAGAIFLHTGSIVNWNRLKRKLTQTPTEELTECINSTIGTWFDSEADKTDLQYATELECLNKKFLEQLPASEREGLKVTVKIFVSRLTPESVQDAVHRAMCELDISNIETVLLSVPEAHHNLTSLQPLWQALEELQVTEKVYSLGVSDLNKAQLQELYDWAKVKPCVNQVNLDSCCVMPQDLMDYAKDNDIQLLTHNDPKEILPEKTFQEIMVNNFTTKDSMNWEPSWVARYSVLIKCRGIIKTKGYIVKAARDIKKRK